MSKVTAGVSVSLDGFIAGPNQSFEHPLGEMAEELLHHWMFKEPGKHQEELDYLVDAGAFIMGSNMFGPKDRRMKDEWQGWWGDTPPYHAPVFVLSHSHRPTIEMKGGTSFTFVTDGIEAAFEQAKKAAGDKKISIAGGAQTINQYLAAGLIDELWLHIAPLTIGSGAKLFENVPDLKMEPIKIGGSETITHVKYKIIK